MPPRCLPNFSPAFTSSLPPLARHSLIPQPNSAPKEATCHIMPAKSLYHLHGIVGENKQDSVLLHLYRNNFKWHITEKHG